MTAADLLIRLEQDLADADRALKHASDILDTPCQRLGISSPDQQIARTYLAQAARGLIGVQAQMKSLFALAHEPQTGDRTTCSQCGEGLVYVGPHWQHISKLQPKHPAIPRED